jgi:hypothetical protein
VVAGLAKAKIGEGWFRDEVSSTFQEDEDRRGVETAEHSHGGVHKAAPGLKPERSRRRWSRGRAEAQIGECLFVRRPEA